MTCDRILRYFLLGKKVSPTQVNDIIKISKFWTYEVEFSFKASILFFPSSQRLAHRWRRLDCFFLPPYAAAGIWTHFGRIALNNDLLKDSLQTDLPRGGSKHQDQIEHFWIILWGEKLNLKISDSWKLFKIWPTASKISSLTIHFKTFFWIFRRKKVSEPDQGWARNVSWHRFFCIFTAHQKIKIWRIEAWSLKPQTLYYICQTHSIVVYIDVNIKHQVFYLGMSVKFTILVPSNYSSVYDAYLFGSMVTFDFK